MAKKIVDLNPIIKELADWCLVTKGLECRTLGIVIDRLRAAPAVDAVEVVHGRWVDNGIPDSMLSGCSVCGFSCGAYSFNFCPNCGAKMDGDGNA